MAEESNQDAAANAAGNDSNAQAAATDAAEAAPPIENAAVVDSETITETDAMAGEDAKTNANAEDAAANENAAANLNANDNPNPNSNPDNEQKNEPATEEEEHSEDDDEEHSERERNADEPTYQPSKELTLADVYNPRNLTWDELEMHLYEWEYEAVAVNEYMDMKVIMKIRNGEHDDYTEEEEQEDEEKEGEGEDKPAGLIDRLKGKVQGDDGSKTKVEFKKGPTHYLNLTDDSAHVVEFYAPW
mmetsp:Transcript_10423/g.22526  ORF Transcript_10423/g.22526 Transcript_10423/m.22526 type:complete len:245 (-) Transcript_10423:1314-2048(-)